MQFAAERSAQSDAMSTGASRLCDGSLLLAARNEHSTVFATLSHQYREKLFRAAHRLTRTREDAEDAVQDTLLRAFVHLGDFEGRSTFGTWLTSITVNSALMILRKKRATRETAMGDNSDFGDGLRYQITDHAPSPETRYARTEEQRILRTAIQRLRPNLRVVVQIYLQGRSLQETAEVLGISLAAAKGRLFHAKKALRRSVITKLVDQRRFAGRLCVAPGTRGAGRHPNTVPRLEAVLPQEEKGDEHVVENQGAPKLRTQSKRRHTGRIGRDPSTRFAAPRGNQNSSI
jgi:RNA polymerase sigma factor (sigma-70 family)